MTILRYMGSVHVMWLYKMKPLAGIEPHAGLHACTSHVSHIVRLYRPFYMM